MTIQEKEFDILEFEDKKPTKIIILDIAIYFCYIALILVIICGYFYLNKSK